MLRSAIEVKAFASTDVERRRCDQVLKNKRKIVQSFFDWVKPILAATTYSFNGNEAHSSGPIKQNKSTGPSRGVVISKNFRGNFQTPSGLRVE